MIRNDDETLVPIKIDVTHKGVRYVDSFTWNINCPLLSAEDFATRTCLDLNLPEGFRWKIALQIQEQCDAYTSLYTIIQNEFRRNDALVAKSHELQNITIGIRHSIVDYSDNFSWNLYSPSNGPELFARRTCSDLGLPLEMEPAIAHRIRETLIRNLLTWIEDPSSIKLQQPIEETVSEVKVSLVQPHQSVDMITNLWKRAKPSSHEEQAALPNPKLPKDKDTNAGIWKK
eukprot:gene6417-12975_t